MKIQNGQRVRATNSISLWRTDIAKGTCGIVQNVSTTSDGAKIVMVDWGEYGVSWVYAEDVCTTSNQTIKLKLKSHSIYQIK